MKEKRWGDITNLLLGIYLLGAPLLGVGFIADVAAINSYLIGTLVVLIALIAISRPYLWLEYSNLVLGGWLILAPFVLGFSFLAGAMWNQIFVGALIAIIAFSVILKKPKPKLEHDDSHDHHGHGHGHA